MSAVTGLLLILVATVGSAFFSGAEIAVLSARRARLESQAAQGRRDARLAIRHLEEAPRTIAVILVGTNLCNVVASALATAIAVDWVGDRGPLVATAILTPTFLFGAEILPKAFFRSRPTRMLRLSAGLLRVSRILLSPLVAVTLGAARGLLAIFGIPHGEVGPVFRRSDLENLFTFGQVPTGPDDAVARSGDTTLRMAGKALDLRARRVGDAMVPLPEDRTCSSDGTVGQAIEAFRACRGRYLAAVDSRGQVEGFLSARSLLGASPDAPLAPFVRPAVLFDAEEPLDQVIQGFRRHHHFVGLIRDRQGSTLGVVTVEDVFEEVVGEIPPVTSEAPVAPAAPADPAAPAAPTTPAGPETSETSETAD